MENLFMERIVKRKKSGVDYAIITAEIVGCVVLSLAALMFVPQLGLFIVVALGYGTWFLVGKRNLEFEYALTDGELDIDRIAARRRRKRVFSAHGKEFEMVAPHKSVYWSNEYKGIKKVLDVTEGAEAEGVWFVVTYFGGERGVVLFQPSAKMIDTLWHINPRKVMRS